jgi:hypothetical protein
MKRLSLLPALVALGTLCHVASAQTVPPTVAPLAATSFTVTNGSLQDTDGVLRWQIKSGLNSVLDLKAPLVNQLRDYDLVQFDFRVASGEISTIEVNSLGNLSGERQYKVANWTTAVTTTPREVWHARTLVLAQPGWFAWDDPDGAPVDRYFRLESLGLAPNTVVEIRNLRFTRSLIYLKPDYQLPITWPRKTVNADGSVSYALEYSVLNMSNRPTEITAKVLSSHTRFKVAIDKESQPVKNGKIATFKLTATMSKDDIAATPEMYAEPLDVEFAPASNPQANWVWHGKLVRSLSPDVKRQVIARESDLKLLREKIAAGNTGAINMTGLAKAQRMADALLGIRFERIPGGHNHVRNNLPTGPGNIKLEPGSFMPEVVNEKENFHETGTPLADLFWKEYMAYGGGAESLEKSYLLTGDEKYAQKAVELFQLFGEQYSYLPWGNMFDPPWHDGSPTLASSRIAGNPTYGSNWYLKWHLQLLSAIAESQSWQSLTPQQKEKIYSGFVLPYATELCKFPPTVSNQTDITNANLLLLGLVFDDATLVHQALLSDAGLLRRLHDITPDGFSSEGRPLTYHLGSMAEYLPALAYLENSGLKVDFPKERLLAAIKMGYQRATLWGAVPASGDVGRANIRVGSQPLADYLYPLFPQEKWLYQIGRNSTFATQAHFFETGEKPDPNAWKQLLETTPHLFADAGMAVLRSGDTPETQIQLTLDYGRAVFHAAEDRNQIDLQAFSQTFTQGVGSLYNAGSGGGLTTNPDKRLQAFITHGSLGHNVVLVDGKDQEAAVGKLLAWSGKPDLQYAISKVDGIAPGVSHTRGAALAKGVIVLWDHVESAQEHTYDWVFHNFGEAAPADGWSLSPTVKPLGDAANYENIVELQQLQGAGVLRLDWDLSKQVAPPANKKVVPEVSTTQLSLWQLPVAGSESYLGYTGMNNPNTVRMADKTPTLFRRVRAKAVDIYTVLEPRREGPTKVKSVAAQGAHGVLVTFADGTQAKFDWDALLKAGVAK